MDYRIVNEADMSQVEGLWDYCFEKKEDPFFQYYFKAYCGKGNTVIGGFEQVDDCDYLKTMVHVNPYWMRLNGVEQLVPYLVGVATAPEARGKHLMGELLKATFKLLRSQGIAFVTLMPIYAGIYLPYGFSFCYEKLKYIWEAGSLPLKRQYETLLTIVHMPVAEDEKADDNKCSYNEALPELLAYIYDNATNNYNGVPKRNAVQWDKLLSVHALEKLQVALVHKNGEPQGYMLYKIENEIFNILELLAITPEAKFNLLHYADAHNSEAKQVEWLAEAWDYTYLDFQDVKLCPQKLPFMMARCIDAKAALKTLKFSSKELEKCKESVIILLEDNIIEGNNHLLELAVEDGRLDVRNAVAPEQIKMDMAAFTQLYMGRLNATELWKTGRLQCKEPSKLVFMDELFPKQNNWINEYF